MLAWCTLKCWCTFSLSFWADIIILQWPHQIALPACFERKCMSASFRLGKTFSRQWCIGQHEVNGNRQIFRSFRSAIINSKTSSSRLDIADGVELCFFGFVSTSVSVPCFLCVFPFWMNNQKVCKYYVKIQIQQNNNFLTCFVSFIWIFNCRCFIWSCFGCFFVSSEIDCGWKFIWGFLIKRSLASSIGDFGSSVNC